MDNILSINGFEDTQIRVAKAMRELRLSKDLSQKTLAETSGVKEPTIKRFERTGEVSFASLLKLSSALGVLGAFDQVIAAARPTLTAELVQKLAERKPRLRGQR